MTSWEVSRFESAGGLRLVLASFALDLPACQIVFEMCTGAEGRAACQVSCSGVVLAPLTAVPGALVGTDTSPAQSQLGRASS